MVKSYFREKKIGSWLSVTLLVLQFRFYKYKVKPYAKKEYINHDKYPVKVNMFFELRQWWHNKFFSALNPDPTTMAMVTNIPPTICFTKWNLLLMKSSKEYFRVVAVFTKSFKSREI
jgi:hypothetical protein